MISISNLTYRYSRRKTLFNNLNLEMQTGRIYGLLGKNGAGKSSLIKNMAGLLTPTKGSCKAFGYEPSRRSKAFLQNMFFIPEETELPGLTLSDFLLVYPPFYPDFSIRDFDQNLNTFGMSRELHLHQLSFGQKKKIYIAFALATNTKLLIMDEPTNGLDIPSKLQFRKLVASTCRENKITLISTHQVRDLDDLIDNVIIIDNSEILLHSDKSTLQRKLYFDTRPEPAGTGALYSESVPAGITAIYPNDRDLSSYTDLEILFNATLSLREKFTKIITT